MTLAPVQLLVVSFDRPDFDGDVLAELKRLRESDVVRVIDLVVVHKDADGAVQRLRHSDLTEADGAVVAALIGLGEADDNLPDDRLAADEELWSLEEAIPNDSAAAIALVEHRWASGLRDAIRATGGIPVADAWIHPSDLAAAGLAGAQNGETAP